LFYVAIDQRIYDDGHGMHTAPAYGLNEFNERYELDPADAEALTKRYEDVLALRSTSRLPIGDAVARVTRAVGMQPCPPCKRRQAALNQFGDRVADWWARGER
jgi:hypothetical protein